MNNKFIIHEVGLRDGLQMEKTVVPTEKKIEWIKKLFESGIDIIQLGSFVNIEKMPQMADTDKLFEYFNNKSKKPDNILLSGLVLNEKGFERGMNCGVDLFCMGVSASETHSKKNTGMTVSEAADRIINIARRAMSENKKVQVSVQSAFGCGFEGKIEKSVVINLVKKYLDAGIRNISLADTAGHADPKQVTEYFSEILDLDKNIDLTCHFHNTYGLGLVNTYAAMNCGVKYIETAIAGLGGCPFTKLAAGNVCTEDFVHLLHRIGLRKNIGLDVLINISKDFAEFFQREMHGMVARTGGLRY